MKKITVLAIAALAISFASCKKEYKCECTWNDDGTTAGSYTIKDTKKKAETACTAYNGSYYTCKIK